VTDLSALHIVKLESPIYSTEDGMQIERNERQDVNASLSKQRTRQPASNVRFTSSVQSSKQLQQTTSTDRGISIDSMADLRKARDAILRNCDPSTKVTVDRTTQSAKHHSGKTVTIGGISIDRIVDSENARGLRICSRDPGSNVTELKQVFNLKHSSPISSTDAGMQKAGLRLTAPSVRRRSFFGWSVSFAIASDRDQVR
jgi:hypothetical protein